MATTYKAIATVTVGSGGAANIEFTSIPGTYTDLLVYTSLRCARANWYSQARLYFNGSTSNHTWKVLLNDVGTPGSNSNTDVAYWYPPAANATASTFSNDMIYIPNYAGSNNKSFSIDSTLENNSTNIFQGFWAALWSSSSAITSIKIDSPISDTFAQYSTATLYGIKNS